MTDFTIKPLGPETWDLFAGLAERHNGVWGGCWCTWFHRGVGKDFKEDPAGPEGNREWKQALVQQGRAHAALVCADAVAVAWCQYGSPDELPHIYFRKEYEAELAELPRYRLTCIFVDKKYRRKGVATLAVQGALDLIAQAGGGLVEAYPHDLQGTRTSASYLYNGTRTLYEGLGFAYERPVGKKNCVMRRVVEPLDPLPET
ncbi:MULTISPECIES: GNAT family N-acetyltransferase [Streptacidiphilus]|uniref:GNAT family N-acetyltransferase n=1 Tax=Streptacidiphilus cavernicola TaxID=3342716 RepID=A0ABV6UW08_9ACTN|nr:GNAT family N-acetyltransferase [Streptacidiphilus jeojiense]